MAYFQKAIEVDIANGKKHTNKSHHAKYAQTYMLANVPFAYQSGLKYKQRKPAKSKKCMNQEFSNEITFLTDVS